jgi:hypothetical protein
MQPNPQILYSWEAPLRPYIKRSPTIIRFYIVLAVLASLVILFWGDAALLLAVLAVLFIFYVLTVTPPPSVTNKITHFGVDTAGGTLRWEVLSHFYFIKRLRTEVLVLVTQEPYFYHAYLVIPNDETRKKVSSLLLDHIMFQEEPSKNLTDRFIDLFSKLLPTEDDEMESDEESKQSFSQKSAHASL